VLTDFAGAYLAGVDAGADGLQRGDLLLAAEQDRVILKWPGERHPDHLPRAGVKCHLRLGALERSQLRHRLLCHQAPRGGAQPVGAGDRHHPRPAFHPPNPNAVLQLPRSLGRQQQRQLALNRRLHRLAELHHRARLTVAQLGQGPGAEAPLAKPARREGDYAQAQLGGLRAVAGAVTQA